MNLFTSLRKRLSEYFAKTDWMEQELMQLKSKMHLQEYKQSFVVTSTYYACDFCGRPWQTTEYWRVLHRVCPDCQNSLNEMLEGGLRK